MSKPKIRVNDGVMYFIEKKDCSIMEWGTVREIKTYKKYKTEYIIETFDGQAVTAWRNNLIKASSGESKSMPKAEYDSIKAEVAEMETRYVELLESEKRPVSETAK
jgi:hypothetical protein